MSKFTDRLVAQGILVNDPTKVINTIPSNTNTTLSDGMFSQLNNAMPYDPVPAVSLSDLVNRLNKLELDNKCLRLKIFSMEGKFTQEEVTNIRKMMMSEDEASRTLADSIIENA